MSLKRKIRPAAEQIITDSDSGKNIAKFMIFVGINGNSVTAEEK